MTRFLGSILGKVFDLSFTGILATLVQFAAVAALAKLIARSCWYWPPSLKTYCSPDSLDQTLSVLPAVTLWVAVLLFALVIGSWLFAFASLGGVALGGFALYYLPPPWGAIVAYPLGIGWFIAYYVLVTSKFPRDTCPSPNNFSK